MFESQVSGQFVVYFLRKRFLFGNDNYASVPLDVMCRQYSVRIYGSKITDISIRYNPDWKNKCFQTILEEVLLS